MILAKLWRRWYCGTRVRVCLLALACVRAGRPLVVDARVLQPHPATHAAPGVLSGILREPSRLPHQYDRRPGTRFQGAFEPPSPSPPLHSLLGTLGDGVGESTNMTDNVLGVSHGAGRDGTLLRVDVRETSQAVSDR